MVRQALEDEAGNDQAEAGTDTHQRRDEADRARDPGARKLVADDAERERVDRAAGALDRPAEQHHRQRRSERADERSAGKRDHDRAEDAVLAEDVSGAPEDRGQHRGAQQVRGQDPCGSARGCPERVLDVRQRRHDDRLEQRERGAGDRQDGQDQSVSSLACAAVDDGRIRRHLAARLLGSGVQRCVHGTPHTRDVQ